MNDFADIDFADGNFAVADFADIDLLHHVPVIPGEVRACAASASHPELDSEK